MKSKKTRPWDKYVEKITAPPSFVDEVPKNYINDEGFEVPENTLMYYNTGNPKFKISDIIESLIGHQNRDWFNHMAFAMCLPLTIANQYGFVVKAVHDAELFWDGTDGPVQVTSEGFNPFFTRALIASLSDKPLPIACCHNCIICWSEN